MKKKSGGKGFHLPGPSGLFRKRRSSGEGQGQGPQSSTDRRHRGDSDLEEDAAGGQRRDIFGAGALRAHRAYEPVCNQAWETAQQDGAGAATGRVSTGSVSISVVSTDPPGHAISASSARGFQKSASGRYKAPAKSNSAKPPGRLAVLANRVLKVSYVQGFMLLLTLSILYCGDLVNVVADVTYDKFLVGVLWLSIVCFGLEWVLSVASSALQSTPYNCSLFFFLDLVATLSIAIDILLMEANNLMENGPIARAARAARIGTRAGRSMRLLRLLRFLRLVRITRFIKALLRHREKQAENKTRRSSEVMLEQAEKFQESGEETVRADTIGAQIGATTTRKVIIMTLMLLIVLPLLERNDVLTHCNAELVELLKNMYRSDTVQGNCTKLQAEVEPWFGQGLVPFSKAAATGLTSRGLIFATVEQCVLYSDVSMMGLAERAQTELARRRRGSEIQAVPCDAVFVDSEGDKLDRRSDTYLLYDMREEEIEVAKFAMGFTTVVVVVLLVFAVIFSSDAEALASQLVAPIGQLMESMAYTSKLELDKVATEADLFHTNVYEVRRLQAAYLNLNGAVGSFAKFTPLEVVRHFLNLGSEAKLGVAQRNVSIFFSDILGFATICEQNSPTKVLALLSEYFESMMSIIVEEQGTMLEFIGDAILAIWNAPNSVPDHAVRAVTTALRMNEALVGLRQRWREQGKPDISIRVGLHSADVFVGNLGSKMRMKYGVLGDGVNLASRLEELNKRYATEILISKDVLDQEGVREALLVRPLDNVVVKGRNRPTPIYEVLAERGRASMRSVGVAANAEKAMQAYLSRDFARAMDHLQKVLELKDFHDPAGAVLAERCRHFLVRPPPEDWDGAEVLKEKTFGTEG